MAKREDHGVFENRPPDLPTCIAELLRIRDEGGSVHRTAVLTKTIDALSRRQVHLDRMDTDAR
jgi:hypothetical protein